MFFGVVLSFFALKKRREEKGRKVRVPKALQTRGSGSMLPQKINFRVSEMPFPAFSAEHFGKWMRTKMQWLVVYFTHL